jgi:hypothetical protein
VSKTQALALAVISDPPNSQRQGVLELRSSLCWSQGVSQYDTEFSPSCGVKTDICLPHFAATNRNVYIYLRRRSVLGNILPKFGDREIRICKDDAPQIYRRMNYQTLCAYQQSCQHTRRTCSMQNNELVSTATFAHGTAY